MHVNNDEDEEGEISINDLHENSICIKCDPRVVLSYFFNISQLPTPPHNVHLVGD